MSRIFISYKRVDKDKVFKIKVNFKIIKSKELNSQVHQHLYKC